MSRLGAALATYLLPVLMATFGANAAIIMLALFPLVGLLGSVAWAPETRNKAIK